MENIREQQISALKSSIDYCRRLINGIHNVAEELKGQKKPDTDVYLQKIIEGIGWIIGIYNQTKDILDETSVDIPKEIINEAIIALNKGMEEKNDTATAEALDGGIATFITTYMEAAVKATENC